MREFIKLDFKKYALIIFCLVFFYLTFLSVLQFVFSGDYVWFDKTVSMTCAIISFTLPPLSKEGSWRYIGGYIAGFILYICLDLSALPWLSSAAYGDDLGGYVLISGLVDTLFYVIMYMLGSLGNQAKNTILSCFLYFMSAIVCLIGIGDTLIYWFIRLLLHFV